MGERESRIERAVERLERQLRFSRRAILRRHGPWRRRGGAMRHCPPILAACGIGPGASAAPSGGSASDGGEPAGRADLRRTGRSTSTRTSDGDLSSPRRSSTETGIDGRATGRPSRTTRSSSAPSSPTLAAGRTPRYDLIVMTDWMIAKMAQPRLSGEDRRRQRRPELRGERRAPSSRIRGSIREQVQRPWTVGITGIGYNPGATGREITSFERPARPGVQGQGRHVQRDARHDAAWHCSASAVDAGRRRPRRRPSSAAEAAPRARRRPVPRLLRQRVHRRTRERQPRGDHGVVGRRVPAAARRPRPAVRHPEEGGILWIDNLAIPKGAAHPVDAQAMMDYMYRPEVAAQRGGVHRLLHARARRRRRSILQHAQEAADGGRPGDRAEHLNVDRRGDARLPTAEQLEPSTATRT